MAFGYYRQVIIGLHGAIHFLKHLLGTKDEKVEQEVNLLLIKKPYLRDLICHSDTEGCWTPAECKNVLRTLQEVQACLPVEDLPGHIGNWTETTKQFIEGLEYCISNKVRAIFC